MICAIVLASGTALATPEERDAALPLGQHPFALPELTHPAREVTIETTGALLVPEAPLTQRSVAVIERIAADLPISGRRWYLGGAYEMATGLPPGGGKGARLIGGNLEAVGRGVWATPGGLALGGTLGLVFPTATYDVSGPASAVAFGVSSARPWDFPLFHQGRVTLRPAVDLRVISGPFTLQFREGIDWAFETSASIQFDLAAVTSVFVGYRIADGFSPGVELAQLYLLDAAVSDVRRSSTAISPGFRISLPPVDLGVSAIATVGATTVSSVVESSFGGRVSSTWAF